MSVCSGLGDYALSWLLGLLKKETEGMSSGPLLKSAEAPALSLFVGGAAGLWGGCRLVPKRLTNVPKAGTVNKHKCSLVNVSLVSSPAHNLNNCSHALK